MAKLKRLAATNIKMNMIKRNVMPAVSSPAAEAAMELNTFMMTDVASPIAIRRVYDRQSESISTSEYRQVMPPNSLMKGFLDFRPFVNSIRIKPASSRYTP